MKSSPSSDFQFPDPSVRVRLLEAAIKSYDSRLWAYAYSHGLRYHDVGPLVNKLWLHVFHKIPVEKYDHLPLLFFKLHQLVLDYKRAARRKGRSSILYTDQVPEVPTQHFGTAPANEQEKKARDERIKTDFAGAGLTAVEWAVVIPVCQGEKMVDVAKRFELPPSSAQAAFKRGVKKLRLFLNAEY